MTTIFLHSETDGTIKNIIISTLYGFTLTILIEITENPVLLLYSEIAGNGQKLLSVTIHFVDR